MILAFACVGMILYVGIGGFALALCRAAHDGDEMQAQR